MSSEWTPTFLQAFIFIPTYDKESAALPTNKIAKVGSRIAGISIF